eukprot:Skav234750  [mRNA]  locus=scaffold14:705521:712984:- [translate_table: standard]
MVREIHRAFRFLRFHPHQGDRIFLYRVQKSMADYTAILMSIYWPPMVQVMCFFVSLAYLIRKRQSDKSYTMAWFSPWSERASSQGAVPQKWIAQFALYDQMMLGMMIHAWQRGGRLVGWLMQT